VWCRSAAKEQAAGGGCARVSFAEVDALIYNTLKVPHAQLELVGVQRVRNSFQKNRSSRCSMQPHGP
jgi:hypothetical protein